MSEYDPENLSRSDDGPAEDATPIRRIGRGDRKRQLRRGKHGESSNPFESLDGALDDSGLIEPAAALASTPGRPLADDDALQGDYIIDNDDRFPPVVVARPQDRSERRSSRSRGSSNRAERSEIDRSQPMANKRRAARQNRVALVFFAATLAVIAYFVYVWQNPYSILNPLAPERPVIYVTATPGAGTPGNADGAQAGAAFPYAVLGDIQTSPAADQCDRIILTGLIHGTTPEQSFAVRLTGSESDAPIDEGVLTSYFEDARAQVYLITLPIPPARTTYTLQMFDLAGQPLSASIPVTVTPSCESNRLSINFTPVTS
jgi:hypothetical protein